MSIVECFSVGTKLYKKVGDEYFEITVERVRAIDEIVTFLKNHNAPGDVIENVDKAIDDLVEALGFFDKDESKKD